MANLLPKLMDLLSGASATGSWLRWRGGRGQIEVDGTFGGTTVTFEVRGPSGNGISLGTAGIFTQAGVAGFELAEGSEIRCSISGGSGVSVNARVRWTGLGEP